MSDYDLGELNAAFAALRTAATPEIQPPGIAAARDTARRRKTTRTVTLAILAILALVVPVATYVGLGFPRPEPPITSPTPEPEPTESPSPSPSTVESPSPAPPPAAPGAAAISYAPLFGGSSEVPSFQIYLPKTHTLSIPIGVRVWNQSGAKIPPITNAKLRMNLSAVSEIAGLVSVTGPCTIDGSQVNCDFGSLNPGVHLYSLTLQARSGAPTHDRRQLDMTATANEKNAQVSTRYSGVTVSIYERLADVIISATNPSGRVGDTVTSVATVRNEGPDETSYVEYSVSMVNSEVAITGVDGCDVQSFTETSFKCRLLDLTPGQTRTFSVSIRIVSCSGSHLVQSSLQSEVYTPYPSHFKGFSTDIKALGC